jgi:hypothetical protein
MEFTEINQDFPLRSFVMLSNDEGRRYTLRWQETLANEKAPDHAGALTFDVRIGSVLGDHRAGPVEAVDQRGRNRLVPVVESDVVTSGEVGAVEQFA